MKNIMTIHKIIFFCFMVCFYDRNSGQTEKQVDINSNSDSSYIFKKIDEIIKPYADSGFVGVALFADSNGVVFNKSYGKVFSSPEPNTPFWIASNTKPITAAAILLLEQEGKLSTNNVISKYFENVPADKEHITIDQLLTHTSGLPNDFICEGEPNLKKAVRQILSQELLSKPGEEFHYTNDGYILLAAIIEIVSKMKYESFLRESILLKSDMTLSGFWGDNIIAVDSINDSLKYKPVYPKIFRNGVPFENWNNKGATGIYSTTLDLYKFVASLKKGIILNQNYLEKLFFPRIYLNSDNNTTLSYGYGWAIVHKAKEIFEIRHRGRSDWMHNNSIYLLPNNKVVIVWAKDLGPDYEAWSTVISKKIIEELNK